MADTLRHYCRHQRCRTKLAEPVDDQRQAFCTPGCHRTFYRSRCAVCERDLGPGSANRKACKRASCKADYRRFRHVYTFRSYPSSQNVKRPSKSPIESGLFWRDREGRGWRWEAFGGEHWLFNRDDEPVVRLIPTGNLHQVRVTPGTDHGRPVPLADAKRLALTQALARLPMDANTAARIARANKQHWTDAGAVRVQPPARENLSCLERPTND